MPTLLTMHADAFDYVAPELVGSDGLQIHFDLNINGGLLKVGDTTRPSLMAYRRVVGYIRSDGRMYDKPAKSAAPYDLEDPGTLGVRLPANDPDLNLDGDITYRVSGYRYVKGDRVAFGPYETLAMPATDVEINLADYVVPEFGAMPDTSDSLVTAAATFVATSVAQTVATETANTVTPGIVTAYVNTHLGDSHIFLDSDGVPYFDAALTGGQPVLADTDGTPYLPAIGA